MGALSAVPSIFRPGITNPSLWFPERPSETQWDRIRKVVLTRDDYTCRYCGHRALKYMHVHHVADSGDNDPGNLATVCVACHAVLHLGNNLRLQTVEIWKSDLSQVEIVQTTRALVATGMSLERIKKQLKLKRGVHAPDSIDYANDLIEKMGDAPRASLKEPLCAIFVKFKRWQIEQDSAYTGNALAS